MVRSVNRATRRSTGNAGACISSGTGETSLVRFPSTHRLAGLYRPMRASDNGQVNPLAPTPDRRYVNMVFREINIPTCPLFAHHAALPRPSDPCFSQTPPSSPPYISGPSGEEIFELRHIRSYSFMEIQWLTGLKPQKNRCSTWSNKCVRITGYASIYGLHNNLRGISYDRRKGQGMNSQRIFQSVVLPRKRDLVGKRLMGIRKGEAVPADVLLIDQHYDDDDTESEAESDGSLTDIDGDENEHEENGAEGCWMCDIVRRVDEEDELEAKRASGELENDETAADNESQQQTTDLPQSTTSPTTEEESLSDEAGDAKGDPRGQWRPDGMVPAFEYAYELLPHAIALDTRLVQSSGDRTTQIPPSKEQVDQEKIDAAEEYSDEEFFHKNSDVAIDNYGNLSLLGGSALEPNSVWYELTPHRNKRGVEEDLDRYEPIAKKAKN